MQCAAHAWMVESIASSGRGAHSPVSDLSLLASCQGLRKLKCRTWVSDLSPLAHCKALTDLLCNHTCVSDLSPPWHPAMH